jgi:16S rRNA (guanine966-N2)-methyltransferase
VIAGEAGGRRLTVPRSSPLRPTADRVKESLFSALGERRLGDAVVLDLYAGTGALGIEALSRGARRAVFVERDHAAVAAVTANLETTGFRERARVVRRDVEAFVGAAPPPEAPFTLVLLDPPYDQPGSLTAKVLAALTPGWVVPGGTVVVERATSSGVPDFPDPWVSTWERCYGDTLVWFATTNEE